MILASFETGAWDNGVGDNQALGWKAGSTSGSGVFGGVTVTVSTSFSGSTTPHSQNLSVITSAQNPNFEGFLFGNDENTDRNAGATLLNYQRLDITFSEPVFLTDFLLSDIDSSPGTNNNTTNWVDAIGAEGFIGSLGAKGTGIAPTFSLVGSKLKVDTSKDIDYLAHDFVNQGPRENVDNSPVNTSFSAQLNFGSQAISAVSLYLFDDFTTTATTPGEHGIALPLSFTVASVPEPTVMSSLVIGLGMIFARRFRRKST